MTTSKPNSRKVSTLPRETCSAKVSNVCSRVGYGLPCAMAPDDTARGPPGGAGPRNPATAPSVSGPAGRSTVQEEERMGASTAIRVQPAAGAIRSVATAWCQCGEGPPERLFATELSAEGAFILALDARPVGALVTVTFEPPGRQPLAPVSRASSRARWTRGPPSRAAFASCSWTSTRRPPWRSIASSPAPGCSLLRGRRCAPNDARARACPRRSWPRSSIRTARRASRSRTSACPAPS